MPPYLTAGKLLMSAAAVVGFDVKGTKAEWSIVNVSVVAAVQPTA